MRNIGRVITLASVKGGVGKSTLALNLAGIYSLEGKRILVVDLDLYTGGIATLLGVSPKRDIYMLTQDIGNNRLTNIDEYVTKYNNNISVLSCPRDPRNVAKIEVKYIRTVIDVARNNYDVIILDTYHMLDEVTLMAIDKSDYCVVMVTNDLVDIKNVHNLIEIFKEIGKTNYKVLLNNSRDTGRDYISLFDVRSMIKSNVDATISRNFYLKNIDKYVLKGEILTLNKFINKVYSKDISNMKKLANNLLKDTEGDNDKHGEE